MFSFVGDTVLDPFAGTGTTLLAAAEASRNAIGVEIDPLYHRLAKERLRAVGTLFSKTSVEIAG
jgi:site-specific DNA-methyltransferase (adenine-specific)